MKTPLVESCLAHPLLCDGAMGTQLMNLGLAPGGAGMLWNSDFPDQVRSVHAAYAQAGCQVLITNSFGGTRSMLLRHELGEHTAELNRLSAILAREASQPDGFVLGDVGPFGDFLEPLGDTSTEELTEIFTQQIRALVSGGVDAILIETMSDPAEAAVAIQAAKSTCALPVIASFSFQKSANGLRTMMGTTPEEVVKTALDAGADLVGTNCGTDLDLADYHRLARELVASSAGRPVMVQPNAGAPISTPSGITYLATPEEMAECANALVELGVSIVGGCCGTTPSHLQAMGDALR
jgi:5-methyltetrahydrofolate--homocysteine methyltransferase